MTFKSANHVYAGIHPLELESRLDAALRTHVLDATDVGAIYAKYIVTVWRMGESSSVVSANFIQSRFT